MQLVSELKDSLFNENIEDVCLDLTEIGIDSIIDNNLLSEIPIAKSIVAIGKTGIALRERNLLKQSLFFIKEFNKGSLSEEQIIRYKNKLNDKKFAEKELGRVLYLLDRNIDAIKSAVLGRMYFAFVKEAISWNKFCELAEANAQMFVEDYKEVVSKEKRNTNSGNYRMGRMIALGIFVETESPAAQKNLMDSWTRNDKKTMLDMMLQSDYQMTSFGKCFAQFISEDLFNEIEV